MNGALRNVNERAVTVSLFVIMNDRSISGIGID
jgi:hypothetical protein